MLVSKKDLLSPELSGVNHTLGHFRATAEHAAYNGSCHDDLVKQELALLNALAR